MRSSALTAALLLLAASAFAEEKPKNTTPDYSRDTLQKLFIEAGDIDDHRPAVRYHIGTVEFRALGTNWRFNYLPLMMPLSGTRAGVTQEWPDPFALTGAQIATGPRAWRTRKTRNAEMRRIEKTERARLRVKTR